VIAKAKATIAKAKDSNLKAKAKAKDIPYCPLGAARPRTCPRGLQHLR